MLVGVRHVVEIRNWVRGPVATGRITWPRLPALKQSNKVSGALPKLPELDVGELHPVATGLPSTYEVGLVQVIQRAA